MHTTPALFRATAIGAGLTLVAFLGARPETAAAQSMSIDWCDDIAADETHTLDASWLPTGAYPSAASIFSGHREDFWGYRRDLDPETLPCNRWVVDFQIDRQTSLEYGDCCEGDGVECGCSFLAGQRPYDSPGQLAASAWAVGSWPAIVVERDCTSLQLVGTAYVRPPGQDAFERIREWSFHGAWTGESCLLEPDEDSEDMEILIDPAELASDEYTTYRFAVRALVRDAYQQPAVLFGPGPAR